MSTRKPSRNDADPQPSQNRGPSPSHDRSRLSRQQSMRAPNRMDRPSALIQDSSKLTRTTTFHHTASGAATKVSRKDLARPSRTPKPEGSSKVPPTLPRKPSSRKDGASESERKERKRRQNTESARRMREMRRTEVEQLEKEYDANEVRIKELELVAEELSRELKRHNTISGPPRSSRSGQAPFEVAEDRPGWFGAPF